MKLDNQDPSPSSPCMPVHSPQPISFVYVDHVTLGFYLTAMETQNSDKVSKAIVLY